MSSDWRYEAQMRAEQMAQAGGREWRDLTGEEQSHLYTVALQEWCERALEARLARAEAQKEAVGCE